MSNAYSMYRKLQTSSNINVENVENQKRQQK